MKKKIQQMGSKYEPVMTFARFGEVFDKTYHNSYRGRDLAVIRAGNTSGTAIITVNSKDMDTVTIKVLIQNEED